VPLNTSISINLLRQICTGCALENSNLLRVILVFRKSYVIGVVDRLCDLLTKVVVSAAIEIRGCIQSC